MIQVLTENDYQTARKYWKVLKGRILDEAGQPVTICHQFKLRAADLRKLDDNHKNCKIRHFICMCHDIKQLRLRRHTIHPTLYTLMFSSSNYFQTFSQHCRDNPNYSLGRTILCYFLFLTMRHECGTQFREW